MTNTKLIEGKRYKVTFNDVDVNDATLDSHTIYGEYIFTDNTNGDRFAIRPRELHHAKIEEIPHD